MVRSRLPSVWTSTLSTSSVWRRIPILVASTSTPCYPIRSATKSSSCPAARIGLGVNIGSCWRRLPPHLEVVATFPRGDLRRSTVRLPSRWLLAESSQTVRRRQTRCDSMGRRQISGDCGIAFVRGCICCEPLDWPLHRSGEFERRARASCATRRVDAAASLIQHRMSHDFTRFDGNLTGIVGAAGLHEPGSSGVTDST